MGDKTKIAWTNATWNPVRGCSIVSPGCMNCYAMEMAHRFSGPNGPYEGLTKVGNKGPVWNGSIRLVHEKLDQPLRWRKPRMIFVNSMSDLFHPGVPGEYIDAVFDVMRNASQHVFQLLTKRTVRAYSYLLTRPAPSNVWVGGSIEDQRHEQVRLPNISVFNADVRFVSVEPILEHIDFDFANNRVDWVIVGGESGARARVCSIGWIASVIKQCRDHSIPVFVKQVGSHPLDLVTTHSKGADPQEWPEHLRVQEWPQSQSDGSIPLT